MRTLGLHTRVASFIGAVALLVQISPAMAIADDHNGLSTVTFTKWGAPRLLRVPQPRSLVFSKASPVTVSRARSTQRFSGDKRA